MTAWARVAAALVTAWARVAVGLVTAWVAAREMTEGGKRAEPSPFRGLGLR